MLTVCTMFYPSVWACFTAQRSFHFPAAEASCTLTLPWMQWFPPPPSPPPPTLWFFDNSRCGAGMSAVQRDTHLKASQPSQLLCFFVFAHFISQDLEMFSHFLLLETPCRVTKPATEFTGVSLNVTLRQISFNVWWFKNNSGENMVYLKSSSI